MFSDPVNIVFLCSGSGPEVGRSAIADKAERSAGSAVDAGHLDMGNMRVNSSTTPQPSAQSASAGPPRRATMDAQQAPTNRVG